MQSIKNEIIGTWSLVSIFYKDHDGNRINLYGDNPKGILMYDDKGYMNAQLGFGKRQQMSSAALSVGTNEEKAEAFNSYMAYYGKYYEKAPGLIIHQVEGCQIPNWEGEEEIRFVEIVNDKLLIHTPDQDIGGIRTKIEVEWKRM